MQKAIDKWYQHFPRVKFNFIYALIYIKEGTI